jgi:hypothetical protein
MYARPSLDVTCETGGSSHLLCALLFAQRLGSHMGGGGDNLPSAQLGLYVSGG